MARSALERFRSTFFANAAMFKKTYVDVEAEFGSSWADEFDLHLANVFGDDDDAYRDAVRGYSRFAIDAMRLQKLFNAKLRYEDCTYEEACEKVYLNEDYMMKLYLPGILVSHFLWRHHYRQFLYYKEKFLPLVDAAPDKRFYEVGTGTGFYTVQMFRGDSRSEGVGIDISPHSRRFTLNQVNGWGFGRSFTPLDRNIIGADLEPRPFVQTIEVLEHLSDPQLFLNHFRRLLAPGGHGFVTAALTAPNADHIYLYWTPDEVIAQLDAAGFEVLDHFQAEAYEGKPGEHVPKVAAFIVS